MEVQNHEILNMDIHLVTEGTRKSCADSCVFFSDTQTLSRDAKERKSAINKLLITIAVCITFMCLEIIGGIKANSLAILTDAAHLLSDVASFSISLFSLWASNWKANARQSYGFLRIEILSTLISIQMIWILAAVLIYEAIARMINGTVDQVQGSVMFLVSSVGLLVNVVMALLLGHDHDGHSGHSHCSHGQGHGHHHGGHSHNHEHEHEHAHEPNTTAPLLRPYSEALDDRTERVVSKEKKKLNINIQGAYLHVLGDSVQSVGVMIGGAIIWYKPEWQIVDLICTLLFSVIVLGTTIRMLRNILEILMESTPKEIDAALLQKELCDMDEVIDIHELHIWAITVGKILLTCHVKLNPDADTDLVLHQVMDHIQRVYNINHVTIQVER